MKTRRRRASFGSALSPRYEWLLRMSVGLLLGSAAVLIMFSRNHAHITLSMVGAIGYSMGLILPERRTASKVASFFFSWVLFYTVLSTTTFLVVERFWPSLSVLNETFGSIEELWIYHIVINIILLLLFALKLENMEMVFAGLSASLVAAPFIAVLRLLGQDTWFEVETYTVILSYFLTGVLYWVLIVSLLSYKRTFLNVLRQLRFFFIATLVVYLIITFVPYIVELS